MGLAIDTGWNTQEPDENKYAKKTYLWIIQELWKKIYNIVISLQCTVYTIIFAYSYFRDFGLHVGVVIREGLNSRLFWCFHYYK